MARYKIRTEYADGHIYIMNLSTKTTHFTYNPKRQRDYYAQTDKWSEDTREVWIFERAADRGEKVEGPFCYGQVKRRLAELGYNVTESPEQQFRT